MPRPVYPSVLLVDIWDHEFILDVVGEYIQDIDVIDATHADAWTRSAGYRIGSTTPVSRDIVRHTCSIQPGTCTATEI